jgi:hypothetical protein
MGASLGTRNFCILRKPTPPHKLLILSTTYLYSVNTCLRKDCGAIRGEAGCVRGEGWPSVCSMSECQSKSRMGRWFWRKETQCAHSKA